MLRIARLSRRRFCGQKFFSALRAPAGDLSWPTIRFYRISRVSEVPMLRASRLSGPFSYPTGVA